MSGAAAMFSLLNVAAKALTGDFPVIELLWARTAGHLAFVVAAFGPRPGRRLFATRNPVFQLARSLLLLGSTAFNFVALRYIGLATAATINFTAPCIVALLAVPMLGERVGARRWMAIGVGFLGVLVVVRPGGDVTRLASLLSLGTAVCYAGYQVLTRLVAATDPPETTVGYSALVGTALTTVLVPFSWISPASWTQLGLLLSMGVTGGIGHYMVARAYMCAPASVVSPFNYVQLLGATATGYLFFGDVPGPTLWLGAALIVASGLSIALTEARHSAGAPLPARSAGAREHGR
jgi:drug/metabolite transporter (DMT)-like permease